jgi:hypothetical protein
MDYIILIDLCSIDVSTCVAYLKTSWIRNTDEFETLYFVSAVSVDIKVNYLAIYGMGLYCRATITAGFILRVPLSSRVDPIYVLVSW